MTALECQWLLDNFKNPLVKVDPRSRGGYVVWMRARLLSLKNETAIIQPYGHRREEEIDVRYLRKWNSKLEPKEGIIPVQLTQNIGELMKENPFQKKYDKSRWDEIVKLYNPPYSKKINDIVQVTGIPLSSVTGFLYSKEGRARCTPRKIHRHKEEESQKEAPLAIVQPPPHISSAASYSSARQSSSKTRLTLSDKSYA